MYTKGPWRVKGYSEGPRVTIESEKDCIATVWENKEASRWMETLSNAQLMAAAPELLEGLKYLLQSYRADFRAITGGELNQTEAVKKALNAINKAEGN